MLRSLRHILEMIRFSHTLFALPFALLAAIMAWTTATGAGESALFTGRHLVGILACMVSARSAAMAFNRLADRRLDARNPRTAGRHLPAGLVSVPSVVAFTLATSAAFVASTLLFLPNPLPMVLSLPVLGFLLLYSYSKRFTALAHFWLGTALMLAPVCVWIALRGEILLVCPFDILPAFWLGMAVMLWVAGFDIIYACQDFAFDAESQLKSVPVRLGIPRALRLAAVCHLFMILVLGTLPFVEMWGGPPLRLGWVYGAGVLAVAILLGYEHSLVRADDLTRVNVAFFHVNVVISLGLLLVGAVDLLWI